jgi:EAL and modified HD-GYP domain-containing signal transduction protein
VGLRDRDQELFLLGMLSLVDAVLDTPLQQVLAGLPLSHDIEDALLGKPNRFRDVIECVVAYERADWSKLAVRTVRLGIPTLDISPLYREALAWSHDAYGTASVAA